MPLKVLYLDDERDLCDIIASVFSSDEIKIVIFTEPSEAIEHARKDPPDLILLDYRIPGTSGDLVAQAMDPAIPKYLISGDLSVSANYKFEKILAKPPDFEEIQKIFEYWHGKK